jgi:hypothetical protein
MNNKIKKYIFLVIFIVIAVMALLEGFAPWSIKHENELEQMYNSLPVMENSDIIEHRKVRKAFRASIFTKYKTSVSKDKIRNYYREKLKENKWVFIKEEVRTYTKSNYRMHELVFEKNNYGMIITFYTKIEKGKSAIDAKSYDYAIALTWKYYDRSDIR